MAMKLASCCWLRQSSQILRRCGVHQKLVNLIRELVRQEVAAEFERQKRTEDALWADCFTNGATAGPREQQNRIMRLASARATLAILSDRK